MPFVSRAGQKLDHAFATWPLDARERICADLGCSTGGFTDCLLQRGAKLVYSIDTGYGVLDWKLRQDPRVVVMERINAMHAQLPQPVTLISIDVAWTRQSNILPNAAALLTADGDVVTLIKPHYEAPRAMLREGILPPDKLDGVLATVAQDIKSAGFHIKGQTQSPINGASGNIEVLAWLCKAGKPPLSPV